MAEEGGQQPPYSNAGLLDENARPAAAGYPPATAMNSDHPGMEAYHHRMAEAPGQPLVNSVQNHVQDAARHDGSVPAAESRPEVRRLCTVKFFIWIFSLYFWLRSKPRRKVRFRPRDRF